MTQPDTNQNDLPDIDAGLASMSTETTAAELLKKQGQRKKLKVVSQKQLKAQILGWIESAVTAITAGRADLLGDEERQKIIDDAESRVQAAMAKARDLESDRERMAREREDLELRLTQQASSAGADPELLDSIEQLKARLASAEQQAAEAQQDVLVVEEDLDNTKRMLQATIQEKDRLNDTIRSHMIHTTDLVQGVLSLDHDLYQDRHQTENPVDDDADPQAAFFHDFAVGTQVVQTLSNDLTDLRTQAANAAPAMDDQEQTLFAQLKAGSLGAVDVAAPVEGLVEALEGARSETVALQDATGATAVTVTGLPDAAAEAGGDQAEVLADTTSVVREMAAALAAARAQIGSMSQQSGEADKLNQAMRDQMVRTMGLVQGVLELDNTYYQSRHQSEHPADESADPQETFYHDFTVGQAVVETLSEDLEALRGGDSERNSELLEQIQAGSLSAVDVAAPVENLVEALGGAREELVGLNSDSSAAMGIPAHSDIGVLPDSDGEAAETIADATAVVRDMATALAAERKRVAGFKALADEADEARGASEEEVVALSAALDAALEAVANKAEAESVETPADLTNTDAPSIDRIAAAKTVLAELGGLSGDAVERLQAAVAEVSVSDAAPEAAVTDEAAEPVATEAPSEDQLVARVEQVAADLEAAEQRESALADRVVRAARALEPVVEAEEQPYDGEIAAVEEAAEAYQEAGGQARGEQLDGAINALLDAVERRAETAAATPAAADMGELRELAGELVEAARHDHQLAQEEATVDLAMAVDSDTEDEPQEDPNALVASSRTVIAALSARRDALEGELSEITAERDALKAQTGDAEGKLAGLRVRQADLERQLANAHDKQRELSEALVAVAKDDPMLAAFDDTVELAAVVDDEGDVEPSAVAAAVLDGRDDTMQMPALSDADTVQVPTLEDAAEPDMEPSDEDFSLDDDAAEAEPAASSADDAKKMADRLAGMTVRSHAVVAALGERRAALARELDEAKAEREQLAAQVAEREEQLEKANFEVTKVGEDLAKMAEELALVRNERDDAKTGLETAQASGARVEELEGELEQVKAELADKDEVVLSGKEVIAHLNDKEKRLAGDLETARAELAEAQADAATKATRLDKAEHANRALSEALSEAAGAVTDDGLPSEGETAVSNARVDLEVALSELPDEDATDIPVRDDLADDLAEHGQAVVAAMRQREQELADRVKAAEAELTAAREQASEVEASQAAAAATQAEVDAELARVAARLDASRNEVDNLTQQLADKAGELAQSHDEVAGLQADVANLQKQADELDGVKAESAQAATDLVAVREELAAAERQLEGYREADLEVANMVGDLATDTSEAVKEFDLQPQHDTKRFTRSHERLNTEVEEAAAVADEPAEVEDGGGSGAYRLARPVGATKSLLEGMREQAGHLRSALRDARDRGDELGRENDALKERLSSAEAVTADRENRISSLEDELAQAHAQDEERGQQVEAAQAQVAEKDVILRDAKAALEEYRARESEKGQGADAMVGQLRDELASERAAREATEAKIADLRDEMETTISGLRTRSEELDKRVAERDERIQALQAELDHEGDDRIDRSELNARIEALQGENERSRSRIAELEQELDVQAGGSGRAGSLAEELKRTQGQRDELMAQIRGLEGDLAEERGRIEGLKTAREGVRRELDEQIGRLREELATERAAKESADEQHRSLREELAGLKAKFRSLTNDGE